MNSNIPDPPKCPADKVEIIGVGVFPPDKIPKWVYMLQKFGLLR